MVKVVVASLLLYSATIASSLAKDSTIVTQLINKYTTISSYYTAFSGQDFSGEIYYNAPGEYYIVDQDYTTIINDTISYKINKSMKQVIISKPDNTYKLYSPIGLISTLKGKFDYTSYDETKKLYMFKAKDKYDFIHSIEIKFTDTFLPEYINVITNDDKIMKYSFSKQKMDESIPKSKFIYKKDDSYEEIDLR